MVENKNLSLREKIKNYREKNKDFLLAQEKISVEKNKTSRGIEHIQGALPKLAFVLVDFLRCLLMQNPASSDNVFSDSVFQTMIRLKKMDYFILFLFYVITLFLFGFKVLSDLPSYGLFGCFGVAFVWGWIFFVFLFFIFGFIFLFFVFFECFFQLVCCFLPAEKKESLVKKYSDEWFYTNLARTNVFVWNLIISILLFSYITKMFSFFKRGKGTFGGGGASGRW